MHRRPSERTFLFGIHPVLEALEEAKPLQRILFLKGKQTDEISDILRQCRALDIPAQAVPKGTFGPRDKEKSPRRHRVHLAH